MKDITFIFPEELTSIKIIPLGDVHRGSQQFDETLFLKTINKIQKDKSCYTILMGDLIDNALKNSKSDVYQATETPQQSIEYIVENLLPIKDKILVITSGNHEERTSKEAGVCVTKHIAKCLNIEDKYADGPFILFGSISSRIFTIFGTHGAGGGTSTSSALNKILNLMQIVPDADIYLMGHTHKPLVAFETRYLLNKIAKKHIQHDALYINGGSFLNFEGSYGEKKLYKPNSKKIPFIIVNNKGEINISIQ